MSAQFDLVIHDNNYQRIALIEFKANNKDGKLRSGMFAKLDISLAEQKHALSLSKKNINMIEKRVFKKELIGYGGLR